MKNLTPLVFIAALLLCPFDKARAAAADSPAGVDIEVCFTLDTTGSMSGLIQGAKNKIWSIANQIAAMRPKPDVKFCLLGFRDITDDYITRYTDLTPDIDLIYKELKGFSANGGGDTPESVNQALKETVFDISWSADPQTLKVVYLVGDSPPHMDYPNEMQYPAISDAAKSREIVINTVQCGTNSQTTPIWQDIASRSGGIFTRLPQSGNVKVIETYMDQDFVALNNKLYATLLPYGAASQQEAVRQVFDKTRNEKHSVISDRLGYIGSVGRLVQRQGDLVDDIDNNVIQLENITDDLLPEKMQGLDLQEKLDIVNATRKERRMYLDVIQELNVERQEFLKKQQAEGGLSFDLEVINNIKEIAASKGLPLH